MFNLIKEAQKLKDKSNENHISKSLSNKVKYRKFSQVEKKMDHNSYQESLKNKSIEELNFIIKDAKEAIEKMPMGPNAGYYADEIYYAAGEKERRTKNNVSNNQVFAKKKHQHGLDQKANQIPED